MPAQKCPPAPVMMPTRTLRSFSTCSLARARPSATARSTALRASGRLIVTIATADSICSVTSGIDLDSLASARRHPQCAIETDGLAVEQRVFDALRCHQRELENGQTPRRENGVQ